MKNPLISIIIPLYNMEEFIELCLRSVLEQTFTDFEIIVVDDKSTDKSIKIAESMLSSSYFPYKIIENAENSGVSATRNRGIKEASGKYLFFLDSDDMLDPHCIEYLVQCLTQYDYDIVVSRHVDIEENCRKFVSDLPFRCGPYIEKHADLLRIHGYVWGALYSKSVIDENSISFNRAYMEDVLFNSEYLLYVHSIGSVPNALYGYRHRGGSLSRPDKREHIAKQNLDCALFIDEHLLSPKFSGHEREIIEDRRYVRNCYFGELSLIGFDKHKKLLKSLSDVYPESRKRELRSFIKKSDLSFSEKLKETVMSFDFAEKAIYRLILGLRAKKRKNNA